MKRFNLHSALVYFLLVSCAACSGESVEEQGVVFDPAKLRAEVESEFENEAYRQSYKDGSVETFLNGIAIKSSDNVEYPYAVEMSCITIFKVKHPGGGVHREEDRSTIRIYITDEYDVSENYTVKGAGDSAGIQGHAAVSIACEKLRRQQVSSE